MLKILHVADIHARDKDIDEIKKCLGFIMDNALVERPDVIIIAGDTFDSQNVKLDSASAKYVFQAATCLANIAPVAILIGTPNHDGMAAEVMRHVRSMWRVTVVSEPKQLFLWDSCELLVAPPKDAQPRAILSMVPAPTKQFFQGNGSIAESDQDIAKAMSAIFMGFGAQAAQFKCPHILAGHWNTTGAYVSETQVLTGVDIEISKDQMLLADADVVCLGHIHKAQNIGRNIYYSGSIYRKDFGELDPKGFFVHEIDYDNSNVVSRFIETPTRKLVKFARDFTGPEAATGIEDPSALCERIALNGDAAGAIVRIELKLWQDDANKIDKDAVRRFCLDHGAESAEIILTRVPRENVRSKRLLSLPTLREKIEEMAEIKNQPASAGVLEKAGLLESVPADQLLEQLAAMAAA